MNYDSIRIKREQEVSQQLFELFEGEIIEKIMKETKIEPEKKKNLMKNILEGDGFRISEAMIPDLHELCLSVKESLQFEEPLDFFVVNDPAINCAAFPRMEEGESHLIRINSGLLERFTNDELRFVLGHEVGHLVSRNSVLDRIINYIFPNMDKMPMVLHNKIVFWNKLSELSADRFGFLAASSLEACISSFFKLSSGLDTARIDFDAGRYLQEMEQKIDVFKKDPTLFLSSHPVNPVRVKAVQIFSESDLFKALSGGETGSVEDNDLTEKMQELVILLQMKGNSVMDEYRRQVIASGGLIVAQGEKGELKEEEIKSIIGTLANYDVFPEVYLREIASSGQVVEKFQEAAANIMTYNPGERRSILNYLIGIVMSDSVIEKSEIEIVYTIGEKLLEFSRLEISQAIGAILREDFTPRYF